MAFPPPNLGHSNARSTHGSHNSTHKNPLIETKISKYIGFFIIGYVLATAIFMMIQTKVALSAQLVTVLSILVGAFIAVHKFIKHHHRALNRDEMKRLTFGSIGGVWLFTALYLFALWFLLFDTVSREVLFEMTMQQPLPLLGALMLILVLTLLSARLGIWLFNRLLAPNYLPKNKS